MSGKDRSTGGFRYFGLPIVSKSAIVSGIVSVLPIASFSVLPYPAGAWIYIFQRIIPMPSIQDVADQINAKLDSITTNTSNTAQNTSDTVDVANSIRDELVTANARLLQLNGTLENGFSNLSQGLFALLQVDIAQLFLLDHHRQQHDTMICELTHVNEQLCNVVRKLARLIELEADELDSIERIEGVVERVHSAEAGDFDRERDLHAKIEKCCPPEKPRPEPCPEACARPEFRPRTPDGLDWKPLDRPQQPNPVG